ncbi:adenosine deaminase 2-A precursor [Danio rerio]|uniref:adenosine deaminase 2-A precursor n=1 Tax=Danio rerio TaxID=7955 RepID=UPI000012750D|nr:adenosine deaminase 2-A precursor [Danio rerio]AAL40922.1 Cecr1 [Danio rerio]|eukprot:NP_001028889.2 adenosine deaminase 2-A precursor [Danio rerio]
MHVLFLGDLMWIYLLLLCCASCNGRPDPRKRDALIGLEASRRTGGDITLNEREKLLDGKLQKLKQHDMEAGQFPPSMHFFKAKRLIDQSPVFNLIQKMPKGAALHVHDFAMVSVDWLVKNVTYRENCYVCFTDKQTVQFIFSSGPPASSSHCSSWTLLRSLREKIKNTTELDNSFIRNLTLFTEDPDRAYPNQDTVWERFEQVFLVAYGLVTYAPVFKDYLYEGLRQFYEDNIMYVEIRALLPQTYELDGRLNDKDWSMAACQEVVNQFKKHHPDFIGARVIFTVHRKINATEAVKTVEEAMILRRNFPDVMAGFDFVGQEDLGRPLWYFKDALSLPEDKGFNLPYFFHAGETDSQGTDVDQNLMDALLFNTTRIGHGFALARHPVVKEMARKMYVPIEVCPISNQVLKLVSDLRDHPAAVLMAEGHPLVISSDDPAVFGATALSHDFYEAFMGFGGMSFNLGTLKELALNSLRYSTLSSQRKEEAIDALLVKWDKFVWESLL